MRNYDAALVAEIAKEAAAGFWLISIGLTTPLYCTDCDIPLPVGGHLYQPRGLQVLEIPQTSGFSVDAARIEVDDTDRAVIAAVENEDAANKEMIISYTVLDSNAKPIAAAELCRGVILGWEAASRKVSFSVGSEFRLWKKKPLRLPTPNCPWAFKGAECAYAGSESWCDQSPERCAVLGNYLNFGGRKYIAAVEDQKIYWGPKGW